MYIDIMTHSFSLTDALRIHAAKRVHFSLSNYEGRILRVVIRLSDINGPRGGEDKCCQLLVTLAGLQNVVVEDIKSDMYVTIDRATNRAGRAVKRRLTRKRDRDRTAGLHDEGLILEWNGMRVINLTGDNPVMNITMALNLALLVAHNGGDHNGIT